MSSSEGVLEESQFLKTSAHSLLSLIAAGKGTDSIIKLYLPENQSQFHRERITRDS